MFLFIFELKHIFNRAPIEIIVTRFYLVLRASGLTVREIARKTGISVTSASRLRQLAAEA
jgi:hypothetical protein